MTDRVIDIDLDLNTDTEQSTDEEDVGESGDEVYEEREEDLIFESYLNRISQSCAQISDEQNKNNNQFINISNDEDSNDDIIIIEEIRNDNCLNSHNEIIDDNCNEILKPLQTENEVKNDLIGEDLKQSTDNSLNDYDIKDFKPKIYTNELFDSKNIKIFPEQEIEKEIKKIEMIENKTLFKYSIEENVKQINKKAISDRLFDYDLIDIDTGFVKDVTINHSVFPENSLLSEYIRLCTHCKQKFYSKTLCKRHHEDSHPTKPHVYVIYRHLTQNENLISTQTDPNQCHRTGDHSENTKQSYNSNSKVNKRPVNRMVNNDNQSSGQTSNYQIYDHIKDQIHSKTSRHLPNILSKSTSKKELLNSPKNTTNDSSKLNSTQISLQNHESLQYKISYKCKICSFTPQCLPDITIRSHLVNEHNYNVFNYKDYYEKVMIKTTFASK